jgi:aminomuconate-semialdehyde/2-hydroxymuconate-6-semialdehyde dehydrogenase
MNSNYVLGKFEPLVAEPAMSFVMSLQATKKAQGAWAGVAVSERAKLLQKFLETLREAKNIAGDLAEAEGLSVTEVTSLQIEAGISLITQALSEVAAVGAEDLGSPTGLILLLPPEVFAFRWLCETGVRALLAGNAVVIRANTKSVAAKAFAQIWDQALIGAEAHKFLLSVYHADGNIATATDEMLIAHPAFRAIAGAGLSSTVMEKIVGGSISHFKKLKLAGLGSNSALLLSDADLELAAEEIVRSLTAAGATPWAINKIFVLESQIKDFEAKLSMELKEAKPVNVTVVDNDRLQDLYKQALAENGKHFAGTYPEPLVISDLSHCSTLQQDPLRAPILFLLPVKYQHEMIKWANTGYLGLVNFVFGSPEKIQKLAARLESGVVIGNRWLHTDFSTAKAEAWPVGVKQSFYGIGDPRIFGDFYSERRIFDSPL